MPATAWKEAVGDSKTRPLVDSVDTLYLDSAFTVLNQRCVVDKVAEYVDRRILSQDTELQRAVHRTDKIVGKNVDKS